MKKIKLLKFNYYFYIALFIDLLGTIINLLVPLLIKNLVDIKKTILNNKNYHIIFIIIIFLLIGILTSTISSYLISKSGDQQIKSIRMKVQEHLIKLPSSYFDNNISGQLSSRVINDASVIKNFTTQTIPNTITSTITLIGTILILLTLDYKLTLLILISFPLEGLITIPIGKINEKISNESQKSLSKLIGLSSESFKNIKSIKLNTAENGILFIFKKNIDKLYKLSLKSDLIHSITNPIQSFLSFLIILFIIIYGGIRVSNNDLSIGTLISFVIYFFQLIGPVNSVADFYSDYKLTIGATSKINAIINTPTEDNFGEKQIDNYNNKKLELKNMYFSYEEKYILKNINMIFESGSNIAIVGPSGAGKTTIINILTRLYNINNGSLLLGNENAEEFDLKSWRSMFAVVTQDNSIISGSIYDNLIFGINYQPTNYQIKESLIKSNLLDDVNKMEQGINTLIGEQGVKLSGGQKQRLSIAQAYLRNPKFLILDEATSNLDSDSEKIVIEALNKLMKGKTIISIAHRLSTVSNADKIYFIDNNKVLGYGSHMELIKKLPEYKRFVEEQMLDYEK